MIRSKIYNYVKTKFNDKVAQDFIDETAHYFYVCSLFFSVFCVATLTSPKIAIIYAITLALELYFANKYFSDNFVRSLGKVNYFLIAIYTSLNLFKFSSELLHDLTGIIAAQLGFVCGLFRIRHKWGRVPRKLHLIEIWSFVFLLIKGFATLYITPFLANEVLLFLLIILNMLMSNPFENIILKSDYESSIQKKNLLFFYLTLFFWFALHFGVFADSRILLLVFVCSNFSLVMLNRSNKRVYIRCVYLLFLLALWPIRTQIDSFEILLILSLMSLLFVGSRSLLSIKSKFADINIIYDENRGLIKLCNNNIFHGDMLTDLKKYDERFYYYGNTIKTGPFTDAVNSIPTNANIAVVGLGLGNFSYLIKEKQKITFYEIDPQIVDLATNTNFEFYLQKFKPNYEIIIGCGRDKLAVSNQKYSLICIDAYSGTQIPKFFFTVEAFNLYTKKLEEDGLLLFHVTNKDKILENYLASLANKFEYVAYTWKKNYTKPGSLNKFDSFIKSGTKNGNESLLNRVLKFFGLEELLPGVKQNVTSSNWVLIAKRKELVENIIKNKSWTKAIFDSNIEALTDKKINYKSESRILKQI